MFYLLSVSSLLLASVSAQFWVGLQRWELSSITVSSPISNPSTLKDFLPKLDFTIQKGDTYHDIFNMFKPNKAELEKLEMIIGTTPYHDPLAGITKQNLSGNQCINDIHNSIGSNIFDKMDPNDFLAGVSGSDKIYTCIDPCEYSNYLKLDKNANAAARAEKAEKLISSLMSSYYYMWTTSFDNAQPLIDLVINDLTPKITTKPPKNNNLGLWGGIINALSGLAMLIPVVGPAIGGAGMMIGMGLQTAASIEEQIGQRNSLGATDQQGADNGQFPTSAQVKSLVDNIKSQFVTMENDMNKVISGCTGCASAYLDQGNVTDGETFLKNPTNTMGIMKYAIIDSVVPQILSSFGVYLVARKADDASDGCGNENSDTNPVCFCDSVNKIAFSFGPTQANNTCHYLAHNYNVTDFASYFFGRGKYYQRLEVHDNNNADSSSSPKLIAVTGHEIILQIADDTSNCLFMDGGNYFDGYQDAKLTVKPCSDVNGTNSDPSRFLFRAENSLMSMSYEQPYVRADQNSNDVQQGLLTDHSDVFDPNTPMVHDRYTHHREIKFDGNGKLKTLGVYVFQEENQSGAADPKTQTEWGCLVRNGSSISPSQDRSNCLKVNQINIQTFFQTGNLLDKFNNPYTTFLNFFQNATRK